MRDYLYKFFAVLDTQAKSRLPMLTLIFLASSLLDMIGVGLVGFFVTLVMSPKVFSGHLPAALQAFIQNVLPGNRFIYFVGLFIIALFVVKSMLAYLAQVKIAKFSYSQQARLQQRLMKIYQNASYRFHLERNSSSLINVIQTVVSNYTDSTLCSALRLFSNFLLLVTLIIFLFYTNPIPLLCMVLLMTLIVLLYDKVFKKRLIRAGEMVTLSSNQMIKSINHAISGLKEIRVLGSEDYFYRKLALSSNQFSEAQGLNLGMQNVPRYLIESVMVMFVIALFMGYLFIKGEAATVLPVLTVFTAAGVRLIPAVNQIMSSIGQMRFSKTILDKMYDELCNVEKLNEFAKVKVDSTCSPAAFTSIDFRNVYFEYPGTSSPAIQNLTLTIHCGQSVGLIGPSGAGKSTLVDILLGFLKPQQGNVLLDSKSIFGDLRSWLSRVAYIPQTIFLADDTLQNNIALGVDEDQIDSAKLNKAVRMAQLSEFVDALPTGLNTIIGERGVRLSGGQRQRVALARAFYHERDVIVMDEATSALDQETEDEVVKAINSFKGQCTMIVIAHRYSTIRNCDVIYKIEKGCLVDQVSYDEIVNKN